jgi:hypothetical protein
MMKDDWNMLFAKDILPAAAPFGSSPLGSVMTSTLQVAEAVAITEKSIKTKNIKPIIA